MAKKLSDISNEEIVNSLENLAETKKKEIKKVTMRNYVNESIEVMKPL